MVADDIISVALLFVVLVLFFLLLIQNVVYNEETLSQALLEVRLKNAAHQSLQALLFSEIEGKQYASLLSAALSSGNKKLMVNGKEVDVEWEADRFLLDHYSSYSFIGMCGNHTIAVNKLSNISMVIVESVHIPCASGNATVSIMVSG